MSTVDEGPHPLLAQVLERIRGEPQALIDFAQAYLRRIPYEADMSPESAAEEIRDLFEFIRQRHDTVDIRLFNPEAENAGTVIQIRVEDVPFLIDSVIGEIQAHGLEVSRVLHPVIGVVRGEDGSLREVVRPVETDRRESVQLYELDRRLDPVDHPHLQARIQAVVGDVLAAVGDFRAMVDATSRMIEAAGAGKTAYPDDEVAEAVAFLQWLTEDNFVFLGYREYEVVDTPDGPGLVVVPESGLGILSDPAKSKTREPVPFSSLPDEVVARYRQGGLLVISKTNSLSTVHRRARMDYIGIRRVGPNGETVGEMRLLGLFTSKAYMESVTHIPVLRRKLADVTAAEDLIAGSHDYKAVVSLIESFPKDELFGLPTEDLRRVVMGLLSLQDRARVRLFVRRDLLDRGVRILVAMPRDRYSADLRRRLQRLFIERFGGSSADYHLSLEKDFMARLHFTVWVPEGHVPDVAFDELDAEVLALTRSWAEKVAEVLAERMPRQEARDLAERWESRLPDYYKTSTQIGVAAGDIENLERLSTSDVRAVVGLQNETEEGPDVLTRVALYERGGKRPLSELAPALEDMGLTVVEEVPTRVGGSETLFIHDFGVVDDRGELLDLDRCADRVAAALEDIWEGHAPSDTLNRLILQTSLTHEQIAVLRAYLTYWRRVSPVFTVDYVNDTLVAHPEITAALVRLFELRFDPDAEEGGYQDVRRWILDALEAVPSLDEDRILRSLMRLIEATVRTNAYRPDRESFTIKLVSSQVPDVPHPVPAVEIFVLADHVEGIHLRAGLRARGGIRWSERRQDYRNEVLGLMKAQVTKNAVIVPTGAKGGFVLRGRDSGPEAVQRAYETYIRGLLDVTDNLVDGEPVTPPGVRAHDGPDPYLVVAADRGTARMSDVANRISAEYGFWLDDAFASGGATGYDHKKLGITARGAWKSLERHFAELGIDPATDGFTAVGIGDMSGDVFGNGMLRSRTMRLIAAFDHRHIFIDPDPDPAAAYEERARLFAMPVSSWADYDPDAISPGGGVYPRDAKKVELSPEARAALGTEETVVTPAELIRIVLAAPVDLLWNGGIGTYVKATDETHDEVGDRNNDAVRIDASQLRARVVVEGGNLGFTPRARIEYASSGGHINADYIDNSAGVNCSDREVNLKILLGLAEQRGELSREERDRLLAACADEVVQKILTDNLAQANRLALDEIESKERMDDYGDLIASLEASGHLDRRLDFLPSADELGERARAGRGLTRPELAAVLAHSKRALVEEVLDSPLPDDPRLVDELARYFPEAVSTRFRNLLWEHPLRRELLATIVTNDVIDFQGPTFVFRLVRRTGAQSSEVVRAYRAADAITGRQAREELEALFGKVDPSVWRDLIAAETRLVSTLTRWYLHCPPVSDAELKKTAEAFVHLVEDAQEWGSLQRRAERTAQRTRFEQAGVPSLLAQRAAAAEDLLHAPDIIEVSEMTGRSLADVGAVFHRVGRAMELDALMQATRRLRVSRKWHRWARQTVEDDLLAVRRRLAEHALIGSGAESVDVAVDQFLKVCGEDGRRVVELARQLLSEPEIEAVALMVVLRQLQALAEPVVSP